MREPLTFTVAQPLCLPNDVAANALAHAAMIRAAGARIVAFPELSITGYELDAPVVMSDDPRLMPIVEACAEVGALALVGAPVNGQAEQRHIGLLAVDGVRATVAYRKMWLGGAEPRRFVPGTRRAVIDVDGWRVGLAICKDSSIPQHASETAELGIDVYAAAVLHHDHELAFQEQNARRVATAHSVFVAMASFAGSTGGGFTRAAGHSAIWSPDGVPIARAGPDTRAFARAILTRTPRKNR
jgi:predicted amidohydrolase